MFSGNAWFWSLKVTRPAAVWNLMLQRLQALCSEGVLREKIGAGEAAAMVSASLS